MLHLLALPAIFTLAALNTAAPIPLRIVDMTHVFDESTLHYPTTKAFEMNMVFNGTYNNSFWLQAEEYSSAIHVGTHMDAPRHFAEHGLTTEQIPLERLVAPAAVVDVTEKTAENVDYGVTVEDLTNWEAETGQMLNGVILLIRTGWERFWSNRTAYAGTSTDDPTKLRFPGMTGEAAQWLIDNRDIHGVGIDTFSIDVGSNMQYPAHRILLGENLFVMENVAKISELPLYGAMLYVMPMKIAKTSGAPARIMATFPEMTFRRGTRAVTEKGLREVIVFN